MWNRLHSWLNDVPLRDRVERQQAALVQIMLIGIFVTAVLVLPICYYASGVAIGRVFTVGADVGVLLLTPIALAWFRRGRFELAVITTATSILLGLALFLIPLGTRGSWIMIAFTIPITLIGLLAGRKILYLTIGSSIAIVVAIGLSERLAPQLVGFGPPQADVGVLTVSAFILMVLLLGLFLDRFGNELRDALTAALVREQDLERLRDSLEQAVAERTTDVHAALAVIQARADEQARLLTEVEQQRATIRDLSVPVIPVSSTTLVMPLVGALDYARIEQLRERALQALERTRASYLMLDTTGVLVIDSEVARGIVAVVQAARLLGARVILVGIRPEVAQAIVGLDIDLHGIHSFTNLQSALDQLAMRELAL